MTVLLVRHARAGSREGWTADDRLRPLSKRGWRQAEALAELLPKLAGRHAGVAVLSSPWVRCAQTVGPLADALDTKVVERDELGEGQAPVAVPFVAGLVDTAAVVCTHGDVIEAVLDALRIGGVDLGPRPAWPKGSTWVLQSRGGAFRSARYVPPPE